MAKDLKTLRFAVGVPGSLTSNIWRFWVSAKGDVYLAVRTLAHIHKFSFHKSGICRNAFTDSYDKPITMDDRLMYKWNRAKTPPAGEMGGARVAILAFPSDYLSCSNCNGVDDLEWIPAAKAGDATYVEIVYTNESEESIHGISTERNLLSYTKLPNSEAVCIFSYFSDWENSDLTMPGNGEVADLLFSDKDPCNTGRPVRLIFGCPPAEGDYLRLRELGGYPI